MREQLGLGAKRGRRVRETLGREKTTETTVTPKAAACTPARAFSIVAEFFLLGDS